MASNGSFNTTGYDGWFLNFSWTETSQNVANNTTTISWKLAGAAGVNGYYYKTRNIKVIINGETVFYKPQSEGYVELYNGTLVASGTYTFQHNADGTRSFSAYAEAGIYVHAVNCSGSATFTLNTIPRASTMSVSDGTLGSSHTITVSRKSTAFTHGLTYTCGSVQYQEICRWDTTSDTVSFVFPIELASQAPNGTKVWVDVYLQTYDSSATPIGAVVSKGIWMSIPESVKPSCTVAVSDPTGYADKFGGYIQGQSQVAIKVNPTIAYGSAINSYLVMVDNNKFTTAEAVSPVIRTSGNVTVNATVTDTRLRTGTGSTTINVIPYRQPTITSLKVNRCNEDGTENGRGLYVKVRYSYVIDTVNGKNGMSGYIQYKKTTETEYTAVQLETAFSVEDGSFVFPAGDEDTYDVQLLLADSFVRVERNTTASTAFTLIHFGADGRSISFGGINNDPGVHVMFEPFTLGGTPIDYIVEQGEKDGWFYRKWNGGYAECWKVYYGYGINSALNNYSGFYYSEAVTVPFPFTFTNLPTVTVDGGSVNYMNFVRVFGKYSDQASFMVVSMVDAGNVDVTVDIKAIGRWK